MKLHKEKCRALHLGRCFLGCPRVSVVGRLREVMMPFSSALVRYIWKALAGSGLPGRTGQVPCDREVVTASLEASDEGCFILCVWK